LLLAASLLPSLFSTSLETRTSSREKKKPEQ